MRRPLVIATATSVAIVALVLSLYGKRSANGPLESSRTTPSTGVTQTMQPGGAVDSGTHSAAVRAQSSRRDELRAEIMRLGRCGNADAILKAQQTGIDGNCMGAVNVQKCTSEGKAAMDKDPNLVKFKHDLAQCSDIANLQNEYYLTLRKAAEAGDVDAQLCFLQGIASDVEGRSIVGISDPWADYQSLARRYVDSAFARGDWRIIKQLSIDHLNLYSGALATIYPYGTPDVAYKMMRLLQKGATGPYADDMTARLKDYQDLKNFQGKSILTEAQIQDGDSWAESMYQTNFAHATRLTQEPAEFCDFQEH